jgi:hypothetical protein
MNFILNIQNFQEILFEKNNSSVEYLYSFLLTFQIDLGTMSSYPEIKLPL